MPQPNCCRLWFINATSNVAASSSRPTVSFRIGGVTFATALWPHRSKLLGFEGKSYCLREAASRLSVTEEFDAYSARPAWGNLAAHKWRSLSCPSGMEILSKHFGQRPRAPGDTDLPVCASRCKWRGGRIRGSGWPASACAKTRTQTSIPRVTSSTAPAMPGAI